MEHKKYQSWVSEIDELSPPQKEQTQNLLSGEPFAKLSKVDDFIPQKRVISGGFNPRHGHLTDVCWKFKTTTSRVRKKVNHAHYKSYTR